MIVKYLEYEPDIATGAFVAEAAVVIGRVRLGAYANIWPGAVLRGDLNDIIIGEYTNIQDGCMCHLERDIPLRVGAYVTVGHGAILHACVIGDGALVGMGAIVLNGAEVGAGAVLGAGSLLPPGKKVPPRTMALGTPAKTLRQLSDDEVEQNRRWAEEYARLAASHSR